MAASLFPLPTALVSRSITESSVGSQYRNLANCRHEVRSTMLRFPTVGVRLLMATRKRCRSISIRRLCFKLRRGEVRVAEVVAAKQVAQAGRDLPAVER